MLREDTFAPKSYMLLLVYVINRLMMEFSCINVTGAAFRKLKSIVRRAHVHREWMEQEDSAENTSKIRRHALVRLYIVHYLFTEEI
jgi:hypothetical protein